MYYVRFVNSESVVTFYNKRLALVISRPDNLSHLLEIRDKGGIYFCIHSFEEGLNGK